jgi:hypothetical protein
MKKIIIICCLLIISSCKDFGELEVKVKLPELLEEVSGIQYSQNEDAFWMLNDSGNSPSLYLVSEQCSKYRLGRYYTRSAREYLYWKFREQCKQTKRSCHIKSECL